MNAVAYVGPVSSSSFVSICGKEHVAVQVDALTSECCFLAVPVASGQVLRGIDGTVNPLKKSWLQIDAILRPFDDVGVIDEIKRDFQKYWRRTNFGEGPYHREYLVHLMREIG
jgi:hypothetical protein